MAVCEQVADGVVRLGTSQINFFLVDDADGLTLVDAGAVRYRPHLDRGLELVGRSLSELRAVVLTHADGDHRGFAEPLRQETGVPVLVHSADAAQARGEADKETEASMLPYLRHPQMWRMIAAFAAGGRPPTIGEVSTFEDGEVLEVPGKPRVILLPGHTPGSVAFHFERHRACFVGDAMFFLNVFTGRRGPQIGPSALNASSDQALTSLERLADLPDDVVLLSGHGDPWTEGARAAVDAARAAGKS